MLVCCGTATTPTFSSLSHQHPLVHDFGGFPIQEWIGWVTVAQGLQEVAVRPSSRAVLSGSARGRPASTLPHGGAWSSVPHHVDLFIGPMPSQHTSELPAHRAGCPPERAMLGQSERAKQKWKSPSFRNRVSQSTSQYFWACGNHRSQSSPH